MPWFEGKDCLKCGRPEGSEFASFSEHRSITLDNGKVIDLCNRCAKTLDERYGNEKDKVKIYCDDKGV